MLTFLDPELCSGRAPMPVLKPVGETGADQPVRPWGSSMPGSLREMDSVDRLSVEDSGHKDDLKAPTGLV